MVVTITLAIVVITLLVSLGAFSNQKIYDDLIFFPPAIRRGQFYRFFTHGLIHADAMHLIFNLIALDSFGENLETYFKYPGVFGGNGKILYIALYVSALAVASIPDYIRHRDHYYFRSLGASGAVSAVIFASILFNPMGKIGLIFIPGLEIPGWIFAIIYLAITTYLAKKGTDNIGHMAHLTGAIYGIVFVYITTKLISGFDIFEIFWKVVTTR